MTGSWCCLDTSQMECLYLKIPWQLGVTVGQYRTERGDLECHCLSHADRLGWSLIALRGLLDIAYIPTNPASPGFTLPALGHRTCYPLRTEEAFPASPALAAIQQLSCILEAAGTAYWLTSGTRPRSVRLDWTRTEATGWIMILWGKWEGSVCGQHCMPGRSSGNLNSRGLLTVWVD